MGTNFYFEPDPCPTCGHAQELHIGKSSAGWQFGFQGYPDKGLVSWSAWYEYMKQTPGIISNEYGETFTLEEFRARVENDDRRRMTNHTEYMRLHYPKSSGTCWNDEQGHPFDLKEFF